MGYNKLKLLHLTVRMKLRSPVAILTDLNKPATLLYSILRNLQGVEAKPSRIAEWQKGNRLRKEQAIARDEIFK